MDIYIIHNNVPINIALEDLWAQCPVCGKMHSFKLQDLLCMIANDAENGCVFDETTHLELTCTKCEVEQCARDLSIDIESSEF